MQSHDLTKLSSKLPLLTLSDAITEAEAMASARYFGELEGCKVGAIHFSGLTPWERHPQDELLQVLEGTVEITVLERRQARIFAMHAGSVCVIPKGLWHRQRAEPAVKLMFITGDEELSFEDRPPGFDGPIIAPARLP